MHALAEYGLMHVKLYEDITRFGHVAISYDYPVMVNGRYLMAPSPIPAFDNPKMHMMPALQLFGAGREKRIYAVPPYTEVQSLDFDDHPFRLRARRTPAAVRRHRQLSRRGRHRRSRRPACSFARTPTIAKRGVARAMTGERVGGGVSAMKEDTLLSARGLTLSFGMIPALVDVDADFWPGEVLAVVGESGSGKTSLLNVLSGRWQPRCRHGVVPRPRGAGCTTCTPCRSPRCARCTAPTGALCIRTRARTCAWASPPAATSASG